MLSASIELFEPSSTDDQTFESSNHGAPEDATKPQSLKLKLEPISELSNQRSHSESSQSDQTPTIPPQQDNPTEVNQPSDDAQDEHAPHARAASDPLPSTQQREDLASIGMRQRRASNNNNMTTTRAVPITGGRSNDSRRRTPSAQASSSSDPISSMGGPVSPYSSRSPHQSPHLSSHQYSSSNNTPASIPIQHPIYNQSKANNIPPTAARAPQQPIEPGSGEESALSYGWPILFAVMPPLMSLMFGSTTLWGEVLLLMLTAFYLYIIIKVPWDMYHSVRTRKYLNRVAFTSHPPTMSSEAQSTDSTNANTNTSTPQPSTMDFESVSTSYRNAAYEELQQWERFYLFTIGISPFLGGLGLHLVRHFLSQPNQLISNFNVALFVVAAGIKPLLFIMSLARAEATRLQEELNYPTTEVDSLKTRVMALEGQIAAIMEQAATKTDLFALREEHESSVSVLGRSIRRVEKRADQARGFAEERTLALEGRLREVGEGVERSACRLDGGGNLVISDTRMTNGHSPSSTIITATPGSQQPHQHHHPSHATTPTYIYAPPIGRFNSSSSRSLSQPRLMSWTTALFVLTTWLVSMVGYVITRCALFPLNVVGGVVGGVLKLLPAPMYATNQKALTDKAGSGNGNSMMTGMMMNNSNAKPSTYHLNGGTAAAVQMANDRRGSITLQSTTADKDGKRYQRR
ncbi:hypothetical protein SmJEL517_g02231 [Synchytrium microbalum]|uniref:Uncharacterized protein n=1 Tax=Synchytrium microbalum TaxID=1806994 RepID=A0A507CB97_9FUNG|nr:uncharacterized protein SmJEL517_g02231 [Synchytrium microbalum]TPX35276.1 hypothetical protein SmJEL517_g02231 [Synchytrium microbalum]